MRRLARHLFTLCSAVSLLLCVAVCVLWARSYGGPSPGVTFLILAIAAVARVELARRKSFARIASRPCAGRQWLREFPRAGKDNVREFLRIVIDGFALRPKHLLKLRPDDRVMDLYRAINPPHWTAADQMELECFAILLERRYGTKLETIWRDDLTLGEVFGAARSAGRQ